MNTYSQGNVIVFQTGVIGNAYLQWCRWWRCKWILKSFD